MIKMLKHSEATNLHKGWFEPVDYRVHFANKARQLCKQKGITIGLLFEVIGAGHSFLHDVEKRGHSPSLDTIIKIADYFECSLDELVGRAQ